MTRTLVTRARLVAVALALVALPMFSVSAQPRGIARPGGVVDANGVLVERGLGTGTRPAGAAMPPLRLAAGVTLPRSLLARMPMLREIAQGYLSWGAVDDETHWAPFLCRTPLPAALHPSEADAASEHTEKLYRLFASARGAYLRALSGPATRRDDAAVGLVVVKESFVAVRDTRSDGARQRNFEPRDEIAQRGGQWYRRGAFAGLFVMARLPATTPDTDQGWMYATMAPDGQVTAAGRIASCMGCHERATHGRLFGVPSGEGAPHPAP